MTFTESNTVERMILDAVANRVGAEQWVFQQATPGWGDSLGGEFRPTKWDYVPAVQLLRKTSDVMVESWVREALIRLNPEIAAQTGPRRRGHLQAPRLHPLRAGRRPGAGQRELHGWLRGEKTMPFGPNGEHVTVRLVDSTTCKQPADGLQPVDLSGRRSREAV